MAAFDPPDPRDIVAAVSPYAELSVLDVGVLRGTCPFCGSTAFRVRPGHGTFCCYGCGEGGDARAFRAAVERHG
ncbi:hypothetical protein A6A25_24470 [Saccharothrix sp. CB00851]|nr:hypothetical protein A6A25_24470 [Saccharothrix sp. CB00851]